MEYIAALDLGTSKMLAAAAQKNNRQAILGLQETPSGNSIRRGCIYNTEEAAGKIGSVVKKLSESLNPRINKIYVGIGGQSLRTEYYTIFREFEGEGEIITGEIVNSLQEECQKYVPELLEVLHIAAPEYYLDERPEANPTGIRCNNIEAKFLLILGNPSLKRQVETSMEKANIDIAGVFISPLATAEAVLLPEEKKSGCVLVEWGAGITYVSVYKDGLLRYLVTIPLGGNAITSDIAVCLDKTEAEAEELKTTRGDVLADTEEDDLNFAVAARAQEIVANIVEQIKVSGYESALKTGIVLTGGDALLKNVSRLLEEKSGKPVRTVTDNPGQSCIQGLLKLGQENCAKETFQPITKETNLFGESDPKPEEKTPKGEKKPKGPGLFGKIKIGTQKAAKGLFDE